MSTATTDITDACTEVQVCDAVFQDFGGRRAFFGPIRTLSVFEDNSLIRSTLESPGRDHILVVDGGGSRNCALIGGNLAALAVKNRWTGIIVYGCIRDASEIRDQPLGVKALGVHPRKSQKGTNPGKIDVPVRFAGVEFRPSQWLYGDADGIVVADQCVRMRWTPSGWKV